jgi:hypothetical protein
MVRSIEARSKSPTRENSVNSGSKSSSAKMLPAEIVKVESITKHSFFENLNYRLNVLVPLHEEKELSVPIDSFVQQAQVGDKAKWVRFGS